MFPCYSLVDCFSIIVLIIIVYVVLKNYVPSLLFMIIVINITTHTSMVESRRRSFR